MSDGHRLSLGTVNGPPEARAIEGVGATKGKLLGSHGSSGLCASIRFLRPLLCWRSVCETLQEAPATSDVL